MKKYHHKFLSPPEKDNYFVATGEVEFGKIMQSTGHFNNIQFEKDKELFADRLHNMSCVNRSGYTCLKKNCKYPNCLKRK